MSIHHQLLSHLNPMLRLVRGVGVKSGMISGNCLRVLIYHDIPANELDHFESQLCWLKKSWNIITPAQFEQMISGTEPIIGNNLLITFDDGFLSNRIAADQVLNKLNIKALFFVISDFVSIDDHDEALKFIADHIIPGSTISDIPKSWGNMQWDDLQVLLEQGHTIGCHTKTHVRLSDCQNEADLAEEIVASADVIMKNLGNIVNHFAYTFGDLESCSQLAQIIAMRKFNFIYSGLRGNNSLNTLPFAIRRDAAADRSINSEYILFNNKLLDSFLGGFADFRYTESKKILDSWCQTTF
jgi:peptidoglycan/xylan/chitin deacetylase (PgdA/CDA1 family)